MTLDRLKALNPTPQTRRYLYRIGVAIGLVLTTYGLVNDHESTAWSLLLSALLGLADSNINVSGTPTAQTSDAPPASPSSLP